MSTTTHPQSKKAGRRSLTVTFRIDDARGHVNDYRVKPLACDLSLGQAAWRFVKLGMVDGEEREAYDLRLDEFGELRCDCRGFERFRYCKHADALKTLLGGVLKVPSATHTGGKEGEG